jgi:AhpD family alkylhydroperoxidase
MTTDHSPFASLAGAVAHHQRRMGACHGAYRGAGLLTVTVVITGNWPTRTPPSTEPADPRWRYEMNHLVYPATTSELASHRIELAPETHDAFQAFSKQVFADGALPKKTKQLIAVAVAHVTQCPYCIRGHTRIALRKGATEQEIMEAIWVAAEMRAGGAYAHSVIALDAAGAGSYDQGS